MRKVGEIANVQASANLRRQPNERTAVTDNPYTVTRLSNETGIPKRTILNRINAGDITAIKLGNSTSAWVIPADEAARVIQAQQNDDAA